MVDTHSRRKVFAIVLAAGAASRFGRTKQLETVDGATLVGRAIGTARAVCGVRTILVAGHDSARVIAAAGEPGYIVVNDNYEAGIGSSIAAAVRVVSHAADGVLLMLADQPLVSAAHLEAILEAWSGKADEIIATSFADVAGPPVLFPAAAFEALSTLSGDIGARSLLRHGGFDVRSVACADAEIDIDTPEDLARL